MGLFSRGEAAGSRDVAMANARVSRRRQQEARAGGDDEGARIQGELAEDYEKRADFWQIAMREGD